MQVRACFAKNKARTNWNKKRTSKKRKKSVLKRALAIAGRSVYNGVAKIKEKITHAGVYGKPLSV